MHTAVIAAHGHVAGPGFDLDDGRVIVALIVLAIVAVLLLLALYRAAKHD